MEKQSINKEVLSAKDFYNEISSQYYDPIAHGVSCKVKEINESILRDLRSSVKGPILDVGCGCQKPVAGSIGCDLSIETIKKRKKLFPGSSYVCADINNLPFANKHFAAILAGLMFDHLGDPVRAFSSLKEVATEDAKLVLTIYDKEKLPCFAYLGNVLEYKTAEGKIYKTPSYQRNLQEIREAARSAGWLIANDIISHVTTGNKYYLLQLEFKSGR